MSALAIPCGAALLPTTRDTEHFIITGLEACCRTITLDSGTSYAFAAASAYVRMQTNVTQR
jgi:hypothetical protein